MKLSQRQAKSNGTLLLLETMAGQVKMIRLRTQARWPENLLALTAVFDAPCAQQKSRMK
jgi:hypothetical protein